MVLAFNREFDARYGEAVEVVPGVRRVTATNPGPFTFAGTNTFLIGTRRLAVLDPGPDDAAHVEAVVAAIGGSKVDHILVSHTHRDHSAATRLLQARTGAPVLAGGPHRTARPPHDGEATRLDAAGDGDFQPDEALADGAVLEGDGYRLEAVATPGHTANHLAFALHGEGALFSGDHVMGWSTTIVAPPEGAMADYMLSLDRLLARQERRYLPAHGGAIADGPPYVAALKAHRMARERAILAALDRGRHAITEIVEQVYEGLDARLTPAAALSTLAHLEDLVSRGAITTDGPPTLTARYRPIETIADDAFGSG